MIYVDLSMQIAQSIGTCGVLNRHSRRQHAPGTRQLAQCFNNYSFDTRYTRVPPSWSLRDARRCLWTKALLAAVWHDGDERSMWSWQQARQQDCVRAVRWGNYVLVMTTYTTSCSGISELNKCDASTEEEELGPDDLQTGAFVWVCFWQDHGEGRIFRRGTGNARPELCVA